MNRYLLHCMSPVVALSGHSKRPAVMSAFRGKADIGQNRCLLCSAAYDSKRT
jgi:hypothetical protein